MGLNIIDNFLHIHVVELRVFIKVVISHWLDQIFGIWGSVGEGQHAVDEHGGHVWSIILRALGVIIEGIVISLRGILTEPIWVQAMVMEHVGQDLVIFPKGTCWLPQKVVVVVFIQAFLHIVVDFGEELSFVAEISKETGIGGGMTIGKNVPSNFRSHSEFLLQELMSNHLVIDKVLIIWACFIGG